MPAAVRGWERRRGHDHGELRLCGPASGRKCSRSALREVRPAHPPRSPDPPAVPRYVVIAVPPGPTPTVVFVLIPRFVIPSGPVNQRPIVFIGPEITGGISRLDAVCIGVVHADKCGVIHG